MEVSEFIVRFVLLQKHSRPCGRRVPAARHKQRVRGFLKREVDAAFSQFIGHIVKIL